MEEVVIAGAARTAMGGFQGVFSGLAAPMLGGAAIAAALADAGAGPEQINELLMGCVLSAGQGQTDFGFGEYTDAESISDEVMGLVGNVDADELLGVLLEDDADAHRRFGVGLYRPFAYVWLRCLLVGHLGFHGVRLNRCLATVVNVGL